MAEEIYKEWFVRLRFPEYEQVEIVDGIPVGWERKRLGDVCEITSSKRIFLSDYTTQGVPFYRGKEITIKSKNETISSELFISEVKFKEIDSKFGSPKNNDILITAVGTLGSVYLVKESDGRFYFKDGNLIWLKEFIDESSLYIYYFLKSRKFQHFVEGFSIGSSQKALTIDSLKKAYCLYPPKVLIDRFDKMVKVMINQIETLQQKNKTLKETRDLLLPKLINGKLDIVE